MSRPAREQGDPLKAPSGPLRAPGERSRQQSGPLRAPGERLRHQSEPLRAPGERLRHQSEPLRAPLEISFDYTRSLGPVLSEFMTALAGRQMLGARGADGRVHAPPFEYDPVTGAPPGELIEVGPEGTVISWSWMGQPLDGQPLTRPFGWALIRLDGAGTAMLHAVDAGDASRMRTGRPPCSVPARRITAASAPTCR